ncbi:MAG: hypothetical protein CO137_01185 [Candidatus Magasanikbacteria bacterium CG_4_9_14_3_um_filter_32_9]|uniref:DUF5652 domain-containing protein n=1 Tax=Candidatus Magasanikbacteria bacterium CG_4_9_14_3_um_filter_32_9 TaxID=1974644 RepID=A0A2M7Z780_9BACT|nr:MAG: hypothetical protein CO137_01185 [Candidatus Magasanikbacteria bacterium CG_4_9_14_3_um_filter_32_9]
MEDFFYNLVNANGATFWSWVILIALWSLPWKGLALWKAAQKQQWRLFMVLLVVNTVGILEILYLYKFSEKDVL